MNPGQRTARRLTSKSGLPVPGSVCNSCLARLSLAPSPIHTRTAATAAAAVTPPPAASTPSAATTDAASLPAAQQAYQVKASVVISRPPLLTRTLHPFEKAFFLYQRRLNERLALPFTRYFYYKKGTPGDREWKRKAKPRMTAARDIGVYNAYGEAGWNDELLVGDRTSEPEEQVEALLRDAEGISLDDVAAGEAGGAVAKKDNAQAVVVQRPLPRTTEADKAGDQTSLNRLLDRTLYLVVKNKSGRWVFPEDLVKGREGLHQAAERVIVQAGGINMNTWVVGNAPIGHHSHDFAKAMTNSEQKTEEIGEKVFFMKARIMAGQANLGSNQFGDTEFKWLSKEEIEKTVGAKYYSSVKNMLVER
ncbi:hypothetical protein MBLNU459_g7492t1 [Dothideomycetes sp. NU459]